MFLSFIIILFIIFTLIGFGYFISFIINNMSDVFKIIIAIIIIVFVLVLFGLRIPGVS
mgnify:CR=1 FL=1